MSRFLWFTVYNCPVLYAIAVGQIIKETKVKLEAKDVLPNINSTQATERGENAFLSLASGDLDLSLLTLTFNLVRERDQTCLPCEFGANPFGSSRDISDSKKVTDSTNNRTLRSSLCAIMTYMALPSQKCTKYMVNFHWRVLLMQALPM